MRKIEVNATAHLSYWGGESAMGGTERLELIVKFRMPKKIFKKKLSKTIFSIRDVDTFQPSSSRKVIFKSKEEYYDYVERFIDDREIINEEAKTMIRDWFESKYKKDTQEGNKNKIYKKINKLGKIDIKVSIK